MTDFQTLLKKAKRKFKRGDYPGKFDGRGCPKNTPLKLGRDKYEIMALPTEELAKYADIICVTNSAPEDANLQQVGPFTDLRDFNAVSFGNAAYLSLYGYTAQIRAINTINLKRLRAILEASPWT